MTTYYDPVFVFLSQEDVIEAGGLEMKAALEDVEKTYRLFALGQVQQPHKPVMSFDHPVTGQERYYMTVSMPVYVGGDVNRVGHKWAAESLANQERGDMPMGVDIVLLHDLEHAIPHAIMEGGLITAMRTAAVAGVGAKYLANPESKIAGLVGAGVIGHTMIMAMLGAVSSLEEIRLHDLNLTRAKNLAAEFKDQIEIRVVDNIREAFENADIITTQTTTRQPIVPDEWVPKGSYYAHMAPAEAEDPVFLKTDRLVVDNWGTLRTWDFFPPARLVKEGLLKEDDVVNLGDIMIGKATGRTHADQRIIFANLGMGCLDITVAERIYRNALAKGLGKKIRLWDKPVWV